MSKVLFKSYEDFPIKGVNFIELTPLLANVEARDDLMGDFDKLYDFKKVDYIIAPDARGFIWGSMLAQKYGIGFIPVRKSGKLPQGAIARSIDYKTEYSTNALCMPMIDIKGKNLLFVDDVYATGGTYNAVKKLVTECGAKLIGGAVVVDLELNKNDEIKSISKGNELE